MKPTAFLLIFLLAACSDKPTDSAAASTGPTSAGSTTATGSTTSAGSSTGTPTGTTPSTGTPTGTTPTGTTTGTLTPGAQACAQAAANPGFLDTLQVPNDGMAIFCHEDQNGVLHYLNIAISDCLTHVDHNNDLFPNTICDS